MSRPNAKIEAPPFPQHRPEITIAPSEEPAFEVDWRELAWWFAIPEVGDHTLWAVYDPPEWRLTEYVDMKAPRPAVVHGIEGVEIVAMQHEMGDQEEVSPRTLFARLSETRVQYLATIFLQDDQRKLYTLLDEGFDEDWGESQRRVGQTGRLVRQPDGSYHQQTEHLQSGENVEGIGVCQVAIGGRSFTCLRVLDVGPVISEDGILMEGYLTREGRTVLCRRYNGRQWHRAPGSAHAQEPPWDERFPEHRRIVIDGVTFVHWYDCLSDRACGIAPGALRG
jgi:hypothetical protein